ncbi:S-adenosyl-L-methionine-dependent methyltransferase [Teratosphaeria destructans]|uniref:S-adenosyl-L-methionine-dependent methyltransferase n=1 Tax=Teratosphaeria destructans TaxID=418781 RepID=A0A9W7SLR9_9PEZI|nr:S-adenosyl-L-methionine-dependent methyltransferase [Teratosphaeria destructans]
MASDNLNAWNTNAAFWDTTLGDRGNDLFQQLILPSVRSLVGPLGPGSRVLDLGTGNGMIARDLAEDGVFVRATDFSVDHIRLAATRARIAGKNISFGLLDLLKEDELDRFVEEYRGDERFDVVVGSMLLKELSDLEPLAQFVPKVLKERGRAIFVNPHPCFHKPAAHRVMELRENRQTGVQEQVHWIKVTDYLHIDPVQSQALRGQSEPLTWYHRPIHEMLNPFTQAGLALKEVQEPSFDDAPVPSEIQNYHNYPQIPMLFIFSLQKR